MIHTKNKDFLNVTTVLDDDILIGAHDSFCYPVICVNVRPDDEEILTNIIVGFMKNYMENGIWVI